jgi:hypothetical protein
VDELEVVLVVVVDVLLVNVEDKVIKGHCENEYEKDKKGK